MTDEPKDSPTPGLPEPAPCRPSYAPSVVAVGAVGLIALVIGLAVWASHGASQTFTPAPEVNWRALWDKEQENEKRIAAIEAQLGKTKQP